MSDEERDAGAARGEWDADDAGPAQRSAELDTSGDDLSGVSDPALARRLETIHEAMSTLGMRIDALVTSTTSYRSALTDRLNEYADLVTKLTRSQASDLEEYRRANERTLADLRNGLASSEETLERVGARIDSMLNDAESSDDSARSVLTEVRGVLEAQENMGRFLTESLDRFGDQVLGRLGASEQAAADQVEALRAAVADVDATPDPTLSRLDDRLAGIEDRLAVIASDDTATVVGNRFDTLHAALDDLGNNLRADQADHAGAADAATAVLDELKETLLDLASGEVVGHLWDEVRQVRATIEALVDRDERTVDPGVVEALRADVSGLTSSVRDLLDQAEVVDDQGAGQPDNSSLVALAADVAALRDELSEGLVVEPSDAFGSSVDQLRTDLAGFGERLSVVAELPEELETELRAVRTGVEDIIGRLDEGLVLDDVAAPAESSPELSDQVATLRDQVSVELERIRQLLEQESDAVDLTPLTARLDRLHDDIADAQSIEAPSDDSSPADLTPVLASLGDIQQGVAHLLERAADESEPAERAAATASAAGDGYATVDPDVIDLLREEIRAAGTVSDELVETLSGELKALRRRIRLRAEGELFSDDQLRIIADAVAARLGE